MWPNTFFYSNELGFVKVYHVMCTIATIKILSIVVVVSSPEHKVLMVSYCDLSMSVVRRQQFVLKANSSCTFGPM